MADVTQSVEMLQCECETTESVGTQGETPLWKLLSNLPRVCTAQADQRLIRGAMSDGEAGFGWRRHISKSSS